MLLTLAGTASAQAPAAPPLLKPMPAAGAPPVSAAPIVQPMPAAMTTGPLAAWDDCCPDSSCDWKVLRLNAEYLLWWTKKQQVQAPLVTGTTQNPPDFDTAAGLVDPSTTILAGAGNLDYGTRHGGRLTAALAITDVFDLEASGFLLGRRTYALDFAGDATGSPVLFRPHINMEPPFDGGQTGSPNAGNPVSFPDAYGNGIINIRSTSELWGAEVNTVAHLMRESTWKVSALAGFRVVGLDEDLRINDGGTNLPGNGYVFLGAIQGDGYRLETFDSFGALNHFYGGQIGVEAERQFGRLLLAAKVKLALGGTVQQLNIAGSSGSLAPTDGSPVVDPTQVAYFGGILTSPDNIGRHTRSVFSVVPEITFNAAFDLFSWLRFSAGYTLLYWSNVVRPGDQIDLLVNQQKIPSGIGFDGTFSGNNYPRVLFNQSDYWAHGLNFSAELRY